MTKNDIRSHFQESDYMLCLTCGSKLNKTTKLAGLAKHLKSKKHSDGKKPLMQKQDFIPSKKYEISKITKEKNSKQSRKERNNMKVNQHTGVRLENGGRQICYMNSVVNAKLSSQLFTSTMKASHCITCTYFTQLKEKISRQPNKVKWFMTTEGSIVRIVHQSF